MRPGLCGPHGAFRLSFAFKLMFKIRFNPKYKVTRRIEFKTDVICDC